jgi:hypothetical protein
VENNFSTLNKGHYIREVVSKLGRTVQDCKGNWRKFIHDGIASRYTLANSFELLIFEEILSEYLARCFELL